MHTVRLHRRRYLWLRIILGVTVVVVSLVAWELSRSVVPQASCGSATTTDSGVASGDVATTGGLTGGTRLVSADPGALTCFTDAARACKSASIHIHQPDLQGAGTNYVFAVKRGTSPCQATEYDTTPGTGGVSITATSQCWGVSVTSGGVLLSCDGGPFLVPVAVSGGVSGGG